MYSIEDVDISNIMLSNKPYAMGINIIDVIFDMFPVLIKFKLHMDN